MWRGGDLFRSKLRMRCLFARATALTRDEADFMLWLCHSDALQVFDLPTLIFHLSSGLRPEL
jgi:hypothetical protein